MTGVDYSDRSFELLPPLRDTLYDVCNALWECHESRGVTITSPEVEAIEELLEEGFTLGGSGSSRIVLYGPPNSSLEHSVLKLGRHGDTLSSIGMAQNKTEVQVWRSIGDEYPIVEVQDWEEQLYNWIVMKKGTPITEKYDSDLAEQKANSLASEFETCPYIQENEITPTNCVEINGVVRLADYGILPFDLPPIQN